MRTGFPLYFLADTALPASFTSRNVSTMPVRQISAMTTKTRRKLMPGTAPAK
ncbi:hypothetical protein ACP3A9_000902 [Citrobacter amalonaticus]